MSRRYSVRTWNSTFQHAGFLQLALGIGQDLPGLVAAAHLRREEAELGRLPGDQTELLAVDQQLRAFFHSLRNDAQGFDRRPESGDGQH